VLPLSLVLDTNIVVSGALKPNGLERAALVLAVTPPASLYVSREILAEYTEVLARPEFRMPAAERSRLLDLIRASGRLVAPQRRLAVSRDPDDNIFLECAEAARADYLITGNAKHFPSFWKSTKIVNARTLIEIIAPHLPL
jgi:putative PIN family toxin of toxin-antitoxin system